MYNKEQEGNLFWTICLLGTMCFISLSIWNPESYLLPGLSLLLAWLVATFSWFIAYYSPRKRHDHHTFLNKSRFIVHPIAFSTFWISSACIVLPAITPWSARVLKQTNYETVGLFIEAHNLGIQIGIIALMLIVFVGVAKLNSEKIRETKYAPPDIEMSKYY